MCRRRRGRGFNAQICTPIQILSTYIMTKSICGECKPWDITITFQKCNLPIIMFIFVLKHPRLSVRFPFEFSILQWMALEHTKKHNRELGISEG